MMKYNNVSLRQILPSAVTVLAICAGLASLRMTFDGRLEAALYCILIAALLDALDGKLARFLDTASPFGAELDTLADFFNFGIAPGVLLYYTFYMGTAHATIGFVAAMVLAVCCALRLARFNMLKKSETTDDSSDDYFVGVPAPALGSLALTPVFAHLHGWDFMHWPVSQALFIMGIGLLGVSTIATFSIKRTSIGAALLPWVILFGSALIACLIVFPWPTLIAMNLTYLASLPFSRLAQQRQAQEAFETRV